MIRKVVNFPPEWVAGFTRNQWQLCSGMGGRFEPESALIIQIIEKYRIQVNIKKVIINPIASSKPGGLQKILNNNPPKIDVTHVSLNHPFFLFTII